MKNIELSIHSLYAGDGVPTSNIGIWYDNNLDFVLSLRQLMNINGLVFKCLCCKTTDPQVKMDTYMIYLCLKFQDQLTTKAELMTEHLELNVHPTFKDYRV